MTSSSRSAERVKVIAKCTITARASCISHSKVLVTQPPRFRAAIAIGPLPEQALLSGPVAIFKPEARLPCVIVREQNDVRLNLSFLRSPPLHAHSLMPKIISTGIHMCLIKALRILN